MHVCQNKVADKNISIPTALYLKFVNFKVILNINSSYLLYVLAENQIMRNEFNSYPSYTHITWVGTVRFFVNRKAVYKA